ncbi:MAG: DUF2911 domain-containing protein [Gemmatimonadota bacterium]|nr:MAG: DUF2911 domain-containing protein [Gemmatimonadota bacterium]
MRTATQEDGFEAPGKDRRGDEIRTSWGGVVPWGERWRFGADEATLMITQRPLMFGSLEIPAGASSSASCRPACRGPIACLRTSFHWGKNDGSSQSDHALPGRLVRSGNGRAVDRPARLRDVAQRLYLRHHRLRRLRHDAQSV